MRTVYLLALISLLALTGCHKADEGPTSASGYVRDQVSGQPVPGAQVRLLRSGGGNNILTGGGTLPLDTISADGAGHYALSFLATEGYTYEVQGFAPGYLTGWLDAQPLVRVKGGRKNKLDVTLRPEGYLRIRFLNEAPFEDTLGVGLSGPGNIVGLFYGAHLDTIFIVTDEGGQERTVTWGIASPRHPYGVSHQGRVYCPARDTADFTIRF